MTKAKKIVIGGTSFAILAVGTIAGIKYRDRAVVMVQSGKVQRVETLVQRVTASGEIKPLKYINITANSFGRIVEIAVKEGDRVKTGDLLLKQESVQSSADLRSAQALLDQAAAELEGNEAAFRAAEASLRTAQAEVTRTEADFQKAQLDFGRNEDLLKEGLISRAQFDQSKAAFEVAKAQIESAKARTAQAQAELNRADKMRLASRSRVSQQRAVIARSTDVVNKTIYTAPLSGVITNLPVHVGESAVPGIQNSIGSNLMTLADLSVITAEVRVDETDIVNVKLDQEAEVTVDAIPDRIFKGKVTEVGSSALTRSGQAAGAGITSTANQEAKDFKVVVTLNDPTEALKPGLSATAKITTAVQKNVLAIPIQALTIRELESESTEKTPNQSPVTAKAASPDSNKVRPQATGKKKEEQGVFVIRGGKAIFVPVTTGIMGETEIEVRSGLQEADEIVTGNYKTLRTIKTESRVKVDNKSTVKDAA
ncbi:MAG: efflux RND transporter periplasmic adaptor subunit [Acidobacteriota bacterium]